MPLDVADDESLCVALNPSVDDVLPDLPKCDREAFLAISLEICQFHFYFTER